MSVTSGTLKNKNLKLILFSFFNLFVIFRVDFLVLPFYLYIFASIGLVILIVKFKALSDHALTYIFLCYILLIFFGMMSLILNFSTDFSYLKRLFSIVYKVGLGVFSVYCYFAIFKRHATFNNFVLSFAISCFLFLLTSVFLLFFSDFSDFWIGTIVPRNELLDEGYFFRKSIMGYTGFDELAVYCVSYFCCAKIIADRMNTKKNTLKFWLMYFMLMCGGLLYGRTSLVSALLSIILLFLCVKNKKRLLAKLCILLVCLIFFILILYVISLENDFIGSWFNWAFEPILAMFTKGEVKSLNSLKRMVKLPNIKQLFFGDGMYITDKGYYMATDIGYLRDIYYFGIFGLIAIYLLVISFMKKIYKYRKQNSCLALLFVILLNILILELKGCMWDSSFIYLSMFYLVCKNEKVFSSQAKRKTNKCECKLNEAI